MINLRDKTIFAIAPHVDDVELGAGGTIYQLGKTNRVFYVGLSLPPLVNSGTLLSEFHRSASILGIKPDHVLLKSYDPRNLFDVRMEILQFFYDLSMQYKPDLVFLPNSRDIHQSHEVVFAEGRRAFKYSSILGYELPWNSFDFKMDLFIELSKESVDAKVQAINAYETQKGRMFFSNDIVGDLARVRGKQIGKEYAECFEVIRMIL
ncbi:MAG: PIG-L family deacetylase [Cyclobacteriaceae bacterium]|nr:PIG-L family deacetylase [Cyclobacteriaceae bacterium]